MPITDAIRQRGYRLVGLPDPADRRHGTVSGYRARGCRCERCTTAHRDRRREERARP